MRVFIQLGWLRAPLMALALGFAWTGGLAAPAHAEANGAAFVEIAESAEGETSAHADVERCAAVRGVRNANPGNIRQSETNWLGELSAEQRLAARFVDYDFEQFIAPIWGIRAIAVLISGRRYRVDRGVSTIRELVAVYAPKEDHNDVEAYVIFVVQVSGFEADQELDFDDDLVLHAVIRGLIRSENGCNPYTDEYIMRAIAMRTQSTLR